VELSFPPIPRTLSFIRPELLNDSRRNLIDIAIEHGVGFGLVPHNRYNRVARRVKVRGAVEREVEDDRVVVILLALPEVLAVTARARSRGRQRTVSVVVLLSPYVYAALS
jgi:hypothetical protein